MYFKDHLRGIKHPPKKDKKGVRPHKKGCVGRRGVERERDGACVCIDCVLKKGGVGVERERPVGETCLCVAYGMMEVERTRAKEKWG